MALLKRHHMILAILTVGFVLRLLGISEAGYHHDELSALLRTRFETFEELVRFGIQVDGHPGFAQVFLWFWQGLVEGTPWMIKFPFVLAGTASIYFLFRIGVLLFSKPVGFVAAATFAVSQYGIVYAQWARPYAFGMLAVLVCFYALLCYRSSHKWSWLLLYAVSAAWSGYTHYFALLQVILLSLLWWAFQLNGKQRSQLLVAALVALVLWLPHLNITLYHLNLGGIGDWLELPAFSFGFDLVAYAFHYAPIFAIPFIGAILLLLIRPSRDRGYWLKLVMLSLAFVVPFVLAYYYSHLRSALLHEGTMVFALPFFLLTIAALFQDRHRSFAKFVATWAVVFGSVTLIQDRHHPVLNTNTEFSGPVRWYNELNGLNRGVDAFFDLRPDAVGWLYSHEVEDYDGVQLFESIPEGKWPLVLSSLQSDSLLLLVTAASEPEYLALAQSLYPEVLEVRNYHTASCYLMRRGALSRSNAQVVEVELKSELLGGKEYAYALTANGTLSLPYSYVVAQASIRNSTGKGLKLVLDGDSVQSSYWRSIEVLPYVKRGKETTQAFIANDLRDIASIGEGWNMSTYIWNTRKESGELQALQFRLLPSNPVRYGLFKPIHDNSLVRREQGIIKTLLTLEAQN